MKTMKNETINKACTLTAIKGAGVDVTPDMLTKINRFALKALTEEQVYVRKFLLAHNGIDRDEDRFHEDLLDDYARTAPGKSFMSGHPDMFSKDLPIGLFLDAVTEEMTPAEFKTMTGEEINLPPGITTAKIVTSWLYLLKEEFNTQLIKQIDGGIYRHISIGFSATKRVAVTDTAGNTIYSDIIGPGFTREGSFVYLGAQPGSTSIKKANETELVETGFKPDSDKNDNNETKGGKEQMEKFEKLFKDLGKSLNCNIDESNVIDVVDKLRTEVKSLADIKTTLGDKQKQIVDLGKTLKERDSEIKDLSPLAEEGKAYRDNLVDEYILNKGKLEEVKETKEAHKALKDIVKTYPIDHLKAESKILQGRVNDQFPDEAQLKDTTKSDEKGKDKRLNFGRKAKDKK